ncbi:uncharacterized protein [Eurosta solidaginis]|uniref:uncharacterized protein n=1 Tax=Eurosta solidaginis TaxID=178769 RepID=UPI003530C008
MEISIKWNVCRVCLVEEQRNHAAKYTPIDIKIAKQIHEIAGVQMDNNDNLPDKICHKCLILLKYACHFSRTCRNSDEYLQSIIRKTKSAASMLKSDKQRERSAELMHEMFDYDSELPTINLEDEEQENTIEVDLDTNDEILPNAKVLTEKIGDHREDNKYVAQLINKIPDTSSTQDEPPESMRYVKSQRKKTKTSGSSVNALKEEFIDERVNLSQDLIATDYEATELENYDNQSNNKPQHLEDTNKSICNIDALAYIDEDAEEEIPASTLDIINAQSGYSSRDDNQVNNIKDSNTKFERNLKIGINKVDEHNTETVAEQNSQNNSDLFYIIKVEEPVIGMEDSETSQITDETTNADGDVEGEIIHNLSEADCYEQNGEEHVDENQETNKSIMPLEEYLLDESDSENVFQQEECIELNEANEMTTQPSSTTIKITEQEHHSSPIGRKRLNNDANTFFCDVCGNNFTSRSLRNYHMRIHRNERNFECELCFKRFTAACNLTAHMRIHTGEKPYECKYCFRRFTDRSTHIKHERIHTNEKPFQCNTCGKSFSLSTTLRTHEKVHTNEKPFKCGPCNKSFKLPHQLKAHVLSNQHKNTLMSNHLEEMGLN